MSKPLSEVKCILKTKRKDVNFMEAITTTEQQINHILINRFREIIEPKLENNQDLIIEFRNKLIADARPLKEQKKDILKFLEQNNVVIDFDEIYLEAKQLTLIWQKKNNFYTKHQIKELKKYNCLHED